MTFEELIDTLPNGLHDAELQQFEMDYVHRRLKFDLDIWIGRMGENEVRELYRPARLTIEKVALLVIEPPDANCPWSAAGPMWIDAGAGQPPQSESKLPDVPVGTSVSWMYFSEMNTFLLFAAGSATLDWTGPERNRG